MKHTESRKRAYRMSARADAAAATGARIVEAAIRQFSERRYDEVSLGDIARDAGVTVQTVLRRFGSKEELVAVATMISTDAVRRERAEAPVGDVGGAVRNLMEHYERWGDRILLLLAQEDQVTPLRRVTTAGRSLHYEWVDRVFAPWLARVGGAARRGLRARLIAATDVYVWKIMRKDLGLDARSTEVSMRELVAAVVGEGGS